MINTGVGSDEAWRGVYDWPVVGVSTTWRAAAQGAPPIRCMPLMVATVLGGSLSSPVERGEEHWVGSIPLSSSVYINPLEARHPVAPAAPRVLPATAEQLAEVQRCFGLTKTQLAAVCRVQPQTIYDWYAGNFEAEAENAGRLGILYKLALSLRSAGLRPLAPKLVERKLDQGQVLLDLLRAPVPDQRTIRNVAAHLNIMTVVRRDCSAASLRERHGWTPLTQEQRDENLDANLDSLLGG